MHYYHGDLIQLLGEQRTQSWAPTLKHIHTSTETGHVQKYTHRSNPTLFEKWFYSFSVYFNRAFEHAVNDWSLCNCRLTSHCHRFKEKQVLIPNIQMKMNIKPFCYQAIYCIPPTKQNKSMVMKGHCKQLRLIRRKSEWRTRQH